MGLNNVTIELAQGSIGAITNNHKPDQVNVLAIHGWLDNAASFIPLIKQTPEFNWTAIDLPGHGLSFHRPEFTHYHFVDWITDLVDLIQHHYQGKPLYVVGHSLGGMLTTVLSATYPELVEKVVLIDAAGLVTQDLEPVFPTQLRQALDSRRRFSDSKKLIKQFETAVKARMAAGDIHHASAELLVNRNLTQQDQGFVWRSDKRLQTKSPLRMNKQQAISILQAIQAPVLLCLAKNGLPHVHQAFAEYKSYYPNLKKVNIDGGHHCHMDYAHQVSAELKSFFL